MRLREYSLLLLAMLCLIPAGAQHRLSGQVLDSASRAPVADAQLYLFPYDYRGSTDAQGRFFFEGLPAGDYELIVFSGNYEKLQRELRVGEEDREISILLVEMEYEISEVIIAARREEMFALRRMREVEGTAIYAGKKNEVVVLDLLTVNIATNNARQIFSQVTGLNIYDANDGGLQLNIGGRGLDPNRTASFNTRQNGYDISADVLGYPESYYTPPMEALREIQVIRGAASLQYGTQFGGLLNFKFKKPRRDKKIAWISRQGIGSYNLFTSFNSLSGTVGKFSYYTFANYKRGAGFRPNSDFESINLHAHLGYAISSRTKVEFEFTYLKYLAQQSGGLTDMQFYRDPTYSNRSRNWFAVDWRLFSTKLTHKFTDKMDFSLNVFGLSAYRKAIGFRTNRVSQPDVPSAPRDLIDGQFRNWGAEARLLNRFDLLGKETVLLLGGKFYRANNTAIQGPGTNGSDADFSLASADFPFYPNQSDFTFPNLNLALFGEEIFHITDKFSVTPGLRFEYINTQSKGSFKKIDFDLAGNPIRDTTFVDDRVLERSFVLLGLGLSYKGSRSMELYGNISQNYRSVTYSDIYVVNPSYQIDPNIRDESGFTADLGFRGNVNNVLSYDVNAFALMYNDRLGEVLRAETRINADGDLVETGRVVRARGNIGQALIYGLESMLDWNIARSFFADIPQLKLNTFVNVSLTQSNYLQSEIAGVQGKQVEFIPLANLRTGIAFGYQNLMGSLQYSALSKQYTDASNAEQDISDNQSGIVGAIPAYGVMDLSLSYSWRMLKLETGINNLLDRSYFTRRATGYPGPGIIPSSPRTFYLLLQLSL